MYVRRSRISTSTYGNGINCLKDFLEMFLKHKVFVKFLVSESQIWKQLTFYGYDLGHAVYRENGSIEYVHYENGLFVNVLEQTNGRKLIHFYKVIEI